MQKVSLNKKFIEDNYHFKHDAEFEELEKTFSLLNFPSSNGMSHNYDNLVQDNEVIPAEYYRNRYDTDLYNPLKFKTKKVQHSLMEFADTPPSTQNRFADNQSSQ